MMSLAVEGRKRRPKGEGDHRCTPEEIWKECLHAAGIQRWDLDAASNAFSTIPADVSFDGSDAQLDGLKRRWWGDVWLNPPFSQMRTWVRRGVAEAHHWRSWTLLTHADPSTQWWREMSRFCDARAEWPGRMHFPLPDHPKGHPSGATVLWYTGAQGTRWRRHMDSVGCITHPGAI